MLGTFHANSSGSSSSSSSSILLLLLLFFHATLVCCTPKGNNWHMSSFDKILNVRGFVAVV